MPNVMTALPNIGGALCSTPQSLADAHCWSIPCSNAAKTRNPWQLAGVPQTTGPISAASVRTSGRDIASYCCFTSFFPIVDICPSYEDIA